MDASRAAALVMSAALFVGACSGSDAPASQEISAPSGSSVPSSDSLPDATAGDTTADSTADSTLSAPTDVVVPSPPTPAVPVEGTIEEQAAAYVARFAEGGDELSANVLGAFSVAGVPVVGADGANLVGPIDDIYGLPWDFVWTSQVPATTTRVSLDVMAAGMGASAPYQPVEVTAAGLLDDLRVGLASDDPSERFVASLVAASSRQAGGADPSDPEATPDQVLLDFPTVYVYTGAFFRAVLMAAGEAEASTDPPAAETTQGLLSVSPAASSSLQGIRSVAVQPAIGHALPALLPTSCSDDGVQGWLTYVVAKASAGFALPGVSQFKGLFQSAIDHAAVKGRIPSSAGPAAERFMKRAGFAMAAVNLAAYAAARAALTGDAAINADPLERHKKRSQGPGKSATVFVSVIYDYEHGGPDAAKAINCLALMLTALGSNATIPEVGPAEGVEVEFQPGKNMSHGFQGTGLVMWGPSQVRLKQDTDAGGGVEIDVQGRQQDKDYPDEAKPVDKDFSIRVSAQISPTTASSIGQTFLDALFCVTPFVGGAVGADSAAGCVDYAVDVAKVLKYDLGEFTFALVDWENVTWTASTISGSITITGTVTDITAPFTLNGTFPGGQATLSFVPADEHGGSYSYSGGGSGVTLSGGGTYTLEGNEGEPLTLTYAGEGCASNPGKCAETSAVVALTPQAAG